MRQVGEEAGPQGLVRTGGGTRERATATTSDIAGITHFSQRNFRRRSKGGRKRNGERGASAIFIAGILSRQIATISRGVRC